MAGGDFSQEAYDALREAYANELTSQEEAELQGVNVMGQQLSMETLPVNSPWKDDIKNWNYPSGKSAYSDGEQKTPEEVLEIMRASAARRDAEEAQSEEEDDESMSDEEVDNLIESITGDEEDDTDDDSEETDDEEDEEGEESEVDGEEEGSSEEADGPDDEESGSGDEDGEEDEVEGLSPDDIAFEIDALKAELEAMSFNPEEPQNDE